MVNSEVIFSKMTFKLDSSLNYVQSHRDILTDTPQRFVLVMCIFRTFLNADGIIFVMLEDLVLPLKLLVLAKTNLAHCIACAVFNAQIKLFLFYVKDLRSYEEFYFEKCLKMEEFNLNFLHFFLLD